MDTERQFASLLVIHTYFKWRTLPGSCVRPFAVSALRPALGYVSIVVIVSSLQAPTKYRDDSEMDIFLLDFNTLALIRVVRIHLFILVDASASRQRLPALSLCFAN